MTNLLRGRAAANQRANEILKRVEDIHAPVVLEVGVNRGALSRLLLEGRKDLTLYLVDSWLGAGNHREEYKATNDRNAFRPQSDADSAYQMVMNLQSKYSSRCFIIRQDSVQAAKQFKDKSVDLIFIDADHSYEGVKGDIEAYTRVTRKWIGGHDYRSMQPQFDFTGVDRAVEEAFGDVEVGQNLTWFKCLYAS